MPVSQVRNVDELKRWIADGKPYQEIIDTYQEKYGILLKKPMLSAFRRRHGIGIRIVRDNDLIPWKLEEADRRRYQADMLRAEARRRAGRQLSPALEAKLDRFLRRLAEERVVVHYDPESAEGFCYVPARPGIDTDLVRVPEKITKTTIRADTE
ncbi:hypothetical protein AB0F72_25670 [Actinoplanes sp. NPDC023936]|uniref:hypothetical protein n=1 Tax=Actinoplanes sp. NPDC023936 TaxID=3154910 RepID=UPI0033F77290